MIFLTPTRIGFSPHTAADSSFKKKKKRKITYNHVICLCVCMEEFADTCLSAASQSHSSVCEIPSLSVQRAQLLIRGHKRVWTHDFNITTSLPQHICHFCRLKYLSHIFFSFIFSHLHTFWGVCRLSEVVWASKSLIPHSTREPTNRVLILRESQVFRNISQVLSL